MVWIRSSTSTPPSAGVAHFSLAFDHPPCSRQVRLQACILASQPGQFVLARVSRRPTRRSTQRLECSLLPLPAPLGDRRCVQPLPTKESASAVTIAAFVFFEDPQLVLRRKHAPRRSLGDLGFY